MKSKQKIILGLLVVVMSISSYAYVNYNYYHKEVSKSMVEETTIEVEDELPKDADMHVTVAKITFVKILDVVRYIL